MQVKSAVNGGGSLGTQMSLRIFSAFRAFRVFERRHMSFLRTGEDRDVVCEIGYRQALGTPPTVKELVMADLGAAATLQRRLRRLGWVQQRRSERDRRAIELTLSPRLLKLYEKYAELLPPSSA